MLKLNPKSTWNVNNSLSLPKLVPERLGDSEFLEDHGVRFAYVAGAMAHGIASTALVARMAKQRLLSFLGTGGWGLDKIESAIQTLQQTLCEDEPFGMNLLCNLDNPAFEEATVELYLKYKICRIEASAFMQITPSLVLYRIRRLSRNLDNTINIPHKIMAKVSRPEVALQFLSPPPPRIVQRLLEQGRIAQEEALLAQEIPMADDICIEADSGGHTDKGVASSLVPAIIRLRDDISQRMNYAKRIRIGVGGGLGTPQAIASAFILGADFVLTGSINQATLEAGTSDAVKDLLQFAEPQDTAMAPAGDMFELGAQVQVLSKGVLFPVRANKLYQLYKTHSCLEEIDKKTQHQIETKFFQRSFEQVYDETKKYYAQKNPDELNKMEYNPKHKMAKIFRWYFAYSNRIAIQGFIDDRVNFQISCGPALGSFNQWIAGTNLVDWRNRHVDEIANLLMFEASEVLNRKFIKLFT
ncbi:2-nitropropane dioxygenase [Nostoc sp. ATCC 43529]|nr:2-nitropropane dioxygenase [Nostoc sp. ATCC 43529]